MGKRLFLFCFFSVIAFVSIVSAQTVITVDKYPAIGTDNVYLADTTGSVIVTIGPSGANQNWNFNTNLTGVKFKQEYRVPSSDSLYYIDAFSNAEWVVKSKQFLSMSEIPCLLDSAVKDLFALNSFEYKEGDNIYSIGMGTANPIYAGSLVYDSPQLMYKFPLQLGQSWTREAHYTKTVTVTVGIPVDVNLIVTDLSYVEADAYGKMTIPAGTFDCVRLKTHRTFTLTAKIAVTGTEVASISESFILYDWFTADIGSILQIVSHSGETNENFTDASLVVILDSSNKMTGICDPDCETNLSVPKSFELLQNYPNPFNPETVIKYALSVPAEVNISIYSANGREVSSINRGVETRGLHQIVWNAAGESGKQVPAGVYFYRLTVKPVNGSPGFFAAKKMILLK